MALNENIIKNIANEITRNCNAQNTAVDTDFVIYLVDLLLLNPKYNKLFAKSVNRRNLESFVNACVSMITSGKSAIKTLKIQHIVQTNYDYPDKLVEKHIKAIESCLQPLISEISETYPDYDDDSAEKKLFRKICIYIILASGLGNPGVIMNLKEGMAALQSVFSLDDLSMFIGLPRAEKLEHLSWLVEVVSGVRLFNRDCKKGGEGIPDLPFDLIDASKACLSSLSNYLIIIMQRVNSLTSSIDDLVKIEEETGNIFLDLNPNSSTSRDQCKQIFSLLAFYRQYELFVRKLLTDVEAINQDSNTYVDKFKLTLEELHASVKYKAAVPVTTVFPLFVKLWRNWRAMQNEMYLISTVNTVTGMLNAQQDQVKVPSDILKNMLKGKTIMTDQQRLNKKIGLDEKLSIVSLTKFIPYNDSTFREKDIQYLGFCAVCLCTGALIPCNPKFGLMKWDTKNFGFCSAKMASKFNRDPQRYINETLEYIRSHPHFINLLNVVEDISQVQNVEKLVSKVVPKIKLFEKEIQTEVHPIEDNIQRNYSWNIWEHKKRACQWATITNCRTHSTQTIFSHLRSEIHSQTVDMKDKCLQTKKDGSTNVPSLNAFVWGLRGRLGDGQHMWNLTENIDRMQRLKPKPVMVCDKSYKDETIQAKDSEQSWDNDDDA